MRLAGIGHAGRGRRRERHREPERNRATMDGMAKVLHARIASRLGSDFVYEVLDGDLVVASGVSSSIHWAKHDAGGFHTRARFDELYPEGWEVVWPA